jgi:hypothetical protein
MVIARAMRAAGTRTGRWSRPRLNEEAITLKNLVETPLGPASFCLGLADWTPLVCSLNGNWGRCSSGGRTLQCEIVLA